MNLIPRSFFSKNALLVAPLLIGKILLVNSKMGKVSGRITEVEAYLGFEDAASHAFRGETPRNKVMFERGGLAYVYLSYGCHFCFNIVTGPKDQASAVLIRALEPITGIDLMRKRRQNENLIELTTGPGKLTQALGITLEHSGLNLCESNIVKILDDNYEPNHIQQTKRIGISKAIDLPYRFTAKGSKFLSRKT